MRTQLLGPCSQTSCKSNWSSSRTQGLRRRAGAMLGGGRLSLRRIVEAQAAKSRPAIIISAPRGTGPRTFSSSDSSKKILPILCMVWYEVWSNIRGAHDKTITRYDNDIDDNYRLPSRKKYIVIVSLSYRSFDFFTIIITCRCWPIRRLHLRHYLSPCSIYIAMYIYGGACQWWVPLCLCSITFYCVPYRFVWWMGESKPSRASMDSLISYNLQFDRFCRTCGNWIQ